MTLEYLDMFIGFAAVMLGVSLVITILTHMGATLLNLRGSQLAKGLGILFKHAGYDAKKAEELADKVLTHELISDKAGRVGLNSARATAIKLSELQAIVGVLAENDPTLKNKLSDLKSGVNTWFDSMMDRATQWYASRSRFITVVFAVIVAFALQLDSFSLLRQLSTDAELRASLVSASSSLLETAQEQAADPSADLDAQIQELGSLRGEFEQAKFKLELHDPRETEWSFTLFMGILASAGLLSLGAPFWFKTLSTLSALRPVLAGREESDRRARTLAAGRGGAP